MNVYSHFACSHDLHSRANFWVCPIKNGIFNTFGGDVSQPTLRREGDAGLTGASSMGGKCAKLPPTFIWGKRRKNWKKCGLQTLIVKGSGVVFTHGEGIITPHVCHKGQQPLIKCANMTSKLCILPFFIFFSFFMDLFLFFIFLWSTRVFPLLLRSPRLRWGN